MKKEYYPLELLEQYRQIHDKISLNDFFNKPLHTKTQEIWCAAHFGIGYTKHIGPCSILIDDDDAQLYYDFELNVAQTIHPFQIVECMEPCRRRGDEYRQERSEVEFDDWETGTEEGSNWIKNTIEKKITKYYGDTDNLNLLVYVNFAAYEQDYATISKYCAQPASKFNSVWLLVGNAICCIKSSAALGSLKGWGYLNQSLIKEKY